MLAPGRRPRESFWSGGFAVLVALLIAPAGAAPLGTSLPALASRSRAERWPLVPVTLESAGMREHPGPGDRRFTPEARYRYVVDGRAYTGTRVAYTGNELFKRSTLQKHLIGELEAHLSTGTPFLARVNPADPSDAVLFTELPPSAYLNLMLGLLFGWLSWRVLLGGLIGLVRRRRRAARLAADPRRPWRAEGRWDGFVAWSSSLAALVPGWFSTAYVTALAGTFAFLSYRGTPKPAGQVLVAITGAFALLALVRTFYRLGQHLKWGRARLLLNRIPVAPGEVLEGIVRCGRKVEARDGFELVLLCSEDRFQGRSRKRRELHEEATRVTADLLAFADGAGTAIPVRLAVPASLPGTSLDGRTYWQLEVRSATPGIDLLLRFDLPVYVDPEESLVERRV